MHIEVVTGQEGGFFAEFVPLVGEVLPFTRAPITVTLGAAPFAVVGDSSRVGFEPITGRDGAPITVHNARNAFGPEFRTGRGVGQSEGPFGEFEVAIWNRRIAPRGFAVEFQ